VADSEKDPGAERRKRLAGRFSEPEKQTPEPKPEAEADPPGGKVKLQPYVAADLAEAARNAWWHTRNQPEGFETFSDLMEAALADKVRELEEQYNDGRPFEPRPRRRLRAGRPQGR
jgi:hypothetical protein